MIDGWLEEPDEDFQSLNHGSSKLSDNEGSPLGQTNVAHQHALSRVRQGIFSRQQLHRVKYSLQGNFGWGRAAREGCPAAAPPHEPTKTSQRWLCGLPRLYERSPRVV